MRGAKQKEMFEISDLRRRVRSVCPFVPLCVCVGGGTLIFSCIRRLWLFLGLKILNFNLFIYYFFFCGGGGGGGGGGVQMILRIFFGGSSQIGLYLEVISMHFRVFSEGQGTGWRIFFGLLKRQIFIWGT